MMKLGSIRKGLPPEKGQEGFTLIELLVTLTILTMVLSMFAMNVARRDNTPTARELARQVQSMLYLARSQAITTGASTTVRVNIKTKSFRYESGKDVQLSDGDRLRVVAGREMKSGEDEIDIVFLPDGGSSGADIEITDKRDRKAMVRINWLTGLPALTAGVSG